MCFCSLSSFAVAAQHPDVEAELRTHGAEPSTTSSVLPPAQLLTASARCPAAVKSCHVATQSQGSDLGVSAHTVLFAPCHSPGLLPCPDSSKLWGHVPKLPLHPVPLPRPQPPAAAANSVSAGAPGSKSASHHPRASCVALSLGRLPTCAGSEALARGCPVRPALQQARSAGWLRAHGEQEGCPEKSQ